MTTTTKSGSAGFSAEEKAAMKQRARELKASSKKADMLAACEEAIAGMPEHDRVLAQKIHEIVTATAPALDPKTYYGMPAYANADGKVVCFFQPSEKFGTRYCTLGFESPAQLDDGAVWPTHFALLEIGAAEEERLTALVARAAG
ncbi:DUF1801 domain-containing protein [Schumannella soli]|uniref:DUF1801 domain-containing protein n=1 Tax=Schumannella soli TaxID=2590779 RepID=A0A506Y2R2_9MICO|nr:DUF1801 domain-containing protein [Schumannella soli]TPW76203.1 DUF1801 domain-containing protein [Schumannella soli]